ncbi:hypothetical protein ACIRBX_15700 [Kitasatospora sp. NPDC096147]|uniref:hypothetical protein n=1 Tax=Kitasatospora sp. NPDC096147 TaxID=3364093 RepID=UPI00380F7D97
MSTEQDRADRAVAVALRELADRQEVTGPVPVDELLRRGRRGRRLRATTRVAAVAVGIGAVATAVSVLLPTPPTSLPGLPSEPPAAHSAPPTGGPAVPSPSATAPASAPQLQEAFRARLPPRLTVTGTSGPSVGAASAYEINVGWSLQVGAARGDARLHVSRWPVNRPADRPRCTTPGCTDTDLPDGGRIRVYLPAQAANGRQYWEVSRLRPDGTQVTVSSSNVPGPGDGREPAPNAPLLTEAELTALAGEPAWHQAALTLDPRPVSSSPRTDP